MVKRYKLPKMKLPKAKVPKVPKTGLGKLPKSALKELGVAGRMFEMKTGKKSNELDKIMKELSRRR